MNIKYNIPLKQDTIIVIAYFNSCNYQKPKQNLLEIINQLVSSQHPVCVIEAIMPNADELVLPKEVIHKKLYASKLNIMFLKENLYNIAGHTLNYTKFIFMDGDIIFDKIDWFDSCSRLLDTYDIIQPFERCYWMDKDKKSLMVSLNMNNPILTRESVGKCLYNQNPADPVKYHPGFVWAMTKNYFNKINGFYEEHIIGGGDLSLWYALDTYLDDKEKNLLKYGKRIQVYFLSQINLKNMKNSYLKTSPRSDTSQTVPFTIYIMDKDTIENI